MRLHTGVYRQRKRVCTESWPWEKNSLPHWGIKPASAVCWSNALPTELHPHQRQSPPKRDTGDWLSKTCETSTAGQTCQTNTVRQTHFGTTVWLYTIFLSFCLHKTQQTTNHSQLFFCVFILKRFSVKATFTFSKLRELETHFNYLTLDPTWTISDIPVFTYMYFMALLYQV